MNIKLKTLVRFLSKIKTNDNCWEWKGTITKKGYGQFNLKTKKKVSAHRFSYELFKGLIPEDYTICILRKKMKAISHH